MKNRKSFIVGLKTTYVCNREKNFLRKYKPWGIILFTRNIKTLVQTRKLTDEIRRIFKDKNYPILIDQEGGRVNRLNKIIDLSMFSAKFFGELFSKDKKKFYIYYKIYTNKIAYLLKAIGSNVNTVPVLDIRRKGSDKVIDDRAFSKKISEINKIGDYCIEMFHKNNIGTVIKHIPGHGLAKVDSHKSTPIVNKNLSYLVNNDFSTFKNKKSFFAMTAHIIYNKIDPYHTATHSKKIINLIRKNLKFKNIIISDDLSMKSLKYSLKENTLRAFSAGCNLVLHCNGDVNEMKIVAKNSPFISKFIIKKTSQFYKIMS
jgi:beta-N-acetylhexosaminidase